MKPCPLSLLQNIAAELVLKCSINPVFGSKHWNWIRWETVIQCAGPGEQLGIRRRASSLYLSERFFQQKGKRKSQSQRAKLFKWSPEEQCLDISDPAIIPAQPIFRLVNPPGPKLIMTALSTPVQLFLLFFAKVIVQTIVRNSALNLQTIGEATCIACHFPQMSWVTDSEEQQHMTVCARSWGDTGHLLAELQPSTTDFHKWANGCFKGLCVSEAIHKKQACALGL